MITRTRAMTKFPGKMSGSTSFNLTATGRQTLRDLCQQQELSTGDLVETLIHKYQKLILPKGLQKTTGPKGGASSLFFGKNRGTTTAVNMTAKANQIVDKRAQTAGLSRGDYIEYLLRLEAKAELPQVSV